MDDATSLYYAIASHEANDMPEFVPPMPEYFGPSYDGAIKHAIEELAPVCEGGFDDIEVYVEISAYDSKTHEALFTRKLVCNLFPKSVYCESTIRELGNDDESEGPAVYL